MTQNREDLLEKIRALLSKTTEKGCTEPEMLAAIAKARAMRDAYEVSDEELALAKDEAANLHEEPHDPGDPHGVRFRLGHGVGAFTNCMIWRARSDEGGGFKYVGARADVEWAVWLADHLTEFVIGELIEHLALSLAPRKERRNIIKGFVQGCCARITTELTKKPDAPPAGNSKAPVVTKTAAVNAKLKEIGVKFKCTSEAPGDSDFMVLAGAPAARHRSGDRRAVLARCHGSADHEAPGDHCEGGAIQTQQRSASRRSSKAQEGRSARQRGRRQDQ